MIQKQIAENNTTNFSSYIQAIHLIKNAILKSRYMAAKIVNRE